MCCLGTLGAGTDVPMGLAIWCVVRCEVGSHETQRADRCKSQQRVKIQSGSTRAFQNYCFRCVGVPVALQRPIYYQNTPYDRIEV